MNVKSHGEIQIDDLFSGDRAALNAAASVMAPLTFLRRATISSRLTSRAWT